MGPYGPPPNQPPYQTPPAMGYAPPPNQPYPPGNYNLFIKCAVLNLI